MVVKPHSEGGQELGCIDGYECAGAMDPYVEEGESDLSGDGSGLGQ